MDLVYFLHAERTNLVKIGWTSDIVARVAKLRVACPYDVILLAVRPGTPQLENGYHCHFESRRQHGEWFSFGWEEMHWLTISMRHEYAEAWAYVEREFGDRAPHLRQQTQEWSRVADVLAADVWDLSDSIDMARSARVCRPRVGVIKKVVADSPAGSDCGVSDE